MFEYRDLPDLVPGSGEVLVRALAIGLNFADIYRRQGHYHLVGEAPYIAGYQEARDAAGRLVAVCQELLVRG